MTMLRAAPRASLPGADAVPERDSVECAQAKHGVACQVAYLVDLGWSLVGWEDPGLELVSLLDLKVDLLESRPWGRAIGPALYRLARTGRG